ncbi:MAG: trp operon repressor [Spirochaetaceae bacterium]|jgi:TrpR family trp operon transcriptional repressor|nr:trp operon repressor [Spirochaetaceae bacterium]
MDSADTREAKHLSELARILAKESDSELIEAFLRCLLTPAEAGHIASRWALVKALNDHVPQREIAKTLGVSLCKITRGSRELKKPNSAFRRILTPPKGPPGATCRGGPACGFKAPDGPLG